MSKQVFEVYVQGRKGRPRWVEQATLTEIPSTWVHDEKDYYFATADLSAGTLTYAEHKPAPVVARV